LPGVALIPAGVMLSSPEPSPKNLPEIGPALNPPEMLSRTTTAPGTLAGVALIPAGVMLNSPEPSPKNFPEIGPASNHQDILSPATTAPGTLPWVAFIAAGGIFVSPMPEPKNLCAWIWLALKLPMLSTAATSFPLLRKLRIFPPPVLSNTPAIPSGLADWPSI